MLPLKDVVMVLVDSINVVISIDFEYAEVSRSKRQGLSIPFTRV